MSEVHVTVVAVAPGLNLQPAPAEPLPDGGAFQALLAELEAATEPATPAPRERTDAERTGAADETTAEPAAPPLQFSPSVPPAPAAPVPLAVRADVGREASRAGTAAIASAGSGLPAREAPGTVASAESAGIALAARPDGADSEPGPATTTRVETPAPALLAPSHAPAPAPAAPVHTIALPRPVGAPGWAEDLAPPVATLVRQGEHAAELRVTPPELGPIGVRIDIADRTATVVFVAAHPETRTALEQALPRLAEALAESGIALGDARVAGEWAGDRRDARDEASERRGAAASAVTEASVAPRAQRIGQIDVFA